MSQVKIAAESRAPRTAIGAIDSTHAIDAMSERDLREVAEIERTCGLSHWGYEAYRAEMLRPETIMFVARRREASGDERLHGFIAARLIGNELHINNIAVRPAARRQGIGGALLRAATRSAVQRGAHTILLEVRASNRAAQELYLRHGFQISGRRANYYRTPPEDALVMTGPTRLSGTEAARG